MCGIFGIVSKKGAISNATESRFSEHFFSSLGHRGPDSFGLFVSPDRRVILGHLRLSIIDVESGAQPMRSSDNVTLVFNGEIYNHNVLRKSYKYEYNTLSDTEVILSGFKESGTDSFNLLNGMYALAIYAESDKSLTLAVDPLGIKSLYIYEDTEQYIFSSELTALAQYIHLMGQKLLSIDRASTYNFFKHGMFIDESTPFKNINKLKNGYWLKLSNQKLEGQIHYKPSFKGSDSLKTVLESSVERQLQADVDVCLFLSGGIDSSLVASVASKYKKVKAYCFAFDQTDIDESTHAKDVASNLGLDLEIIRINGLELESLFVDALKAVDEPISDFATIPLLALSRKAKAEYKVCLLGDGGDELFYGYTHHKYWMKKLIMGQHMPRLVFSSGLYSKVVRFLDSKPNTMFKKASTFLKLIYPEGVSYGPFTHYHTYFKNYLNNLKMPKNKNDLNNFEIQNSLARRLLQKSDRITMAASMEGRVPLLDLELYSFSKKFYSSEDCIKNGKGKQPLRDLLSTYLSNEVHQNKKQGFRVPLSDWCSGDFGDRVRRQLFACEHVSEFIEENQLSKIFYEFDNGNETHAVRVFTLYSYSIFMNKVTKDKEVL